MRPESRLTQGLSTEFIDGHLGVKEDVGISRDHLFHLFEFAHLLIVEVIPLLVTAMLCIRVIVATS